MVCRTHSAWERGQPVITPDVQYQHHVMKQVRHVQSILPHLAEEQRCVVSLSSLQHEPEGRGDLLGRRIQQDLVQLRQAAVIHLPESRMSEQGYTPRMSPSAPGIHDP